MKTFLIFVLALLIVSPANAKKIRRPASRPAKQASPSKDASLAKERLTQFIDAWNKKDPNPIGTMIHSEISWPMIDGRLATGKDAVLMQVQDEMAGNNKEVTLNVKNVTVKGLKNEAAIVEADGEFVGLKDGEGNSLPSKPFHIATIFVKENGTWLLAAGRRFPAN